MKKNNLDEMQEQQLLKIEHTGFWIGFWGLTAVIVVQGFLGGFLDHIMGEVAVLLLMCLYMLVSCLKNGIWDRRLQPNWKTNLLTSLIAAGSIGIFTGIRLGKHFSHPKYLLMTALIAALFVFALSFGILSLCSAIYKRRRQNLDAE